MADLFISYAKPNREQALSLADELRGKGFSVWIDQGGIGGAKNWSSEIVEAINACSTMLVLLSPESIASRNVAKEVQLASEKGRNILPIVIEQVALPTVLEYPLVGIQRVYYHDRSAIWNALDLLKGSVRGTDIPSAVGLPSPVDHSIRVAVLPFDDLSPQHDNQWFADGMMDELISTLGHLEHVKVPSRSDVLHYREHKKKSREIAGELGVRYLIEGGVRKAQDKIRINAALTDTQPGEQLWSGKFDGSFDDVFAFQELVSKNIVDALKLKLTPEEEKQIEDRGTENAEAYELYLKGRHEQYYFTKESYLRALDLYEQAAKLDSNYVNVYIGIASVCCVYYREYSKDPKWLKHAEEIVTTADTISGETSKSLWIRGMIEWLKGNNQKAISYLLRATSYDYRNYNVYNILGTIYQDQQNYSLAIEAFTRALELRESTIDYFNLLSALHACGKIDRLKVTAQRSMAEFDRYLLREPNDQNAILYRAFVLLWAGKSEESKKIADLLHHQANLSGYALHNLGCLYDSLGEPKMYLALLREAIDLGYREVAQTRNYPFISNNLQDQKAFVEMIEELEELVRQEALQND